MKPTLIFNFRGVFFRSNRGIERAAMIVCHCQGVSDRAIRRSVRNGAVTREDIARSCGAGSRCGGCTEAIDSILASHSDAESRSIEVVSLADFASDS